MTAVDPVQADAWAVRERQRLAAVAAVNSATFVVASVPGGYSPGPVHGGALSGWQIHGPDLRATLRVDAVGWRGGSGPPTETVPVLVPRYGSDPAEAWAAAELLARVTAGGE